MKYTILILLSFLITSNVHADNQFKEPVTQIIKLVSQDMGYDKPEVAIHIIDAESGFYPLAEGDMKLICPVGPNKGKPVRARGAAQITSCYHPEVTDEQAFNIEFAIRFLVQGLLDGKCKKEWTTCNAV